MTLMYKNEVMQYGKFNGFRKITEYVDHFLTSNCKVLFINSPVTLFSSIKILQHLNTEKVYNAQNDPIFVSLDILKCTENRDCVLKHFELEKNSLLTIECRHAIKDYDVEEFFFKLFNIAKRNPSQKIILIIQQENYVTFMENIKIDFQLEKLFVLKNDPLDLKDFEPDVDPLLKDVLVFQEQK